MSLLGTGNRGVGVSQNLEQTIRAVPSSWGASYHRLFLVKNSVNSEYLGIRRLSMSPDLHVHRQPFSPRGNGPGEEGYTRSFPVHEPGACYTVSPTNGNQTIVRHGAETVGVIAGVSTTSIGLTRLAVFC